MKNLKRSMKIQRALGCWEVVAILVLGCSILTWFRDDFLIAGGDLGIPLNPPLELERKMSLWDTFRLFNARHRVEIFYLAFWSALWYAGLPMVSIEKICFYLVFTSSGLSMLFLTRHLGFARLARLVSATAYMFNLYTVTLWQEGNFRMEFLTYALSPLLVSLWMRGVSQSGRGVRNALFFSFASLLIVTGQANMPIMFMVILPVLLYTFLFFLQRGFSFLRSSFRFISLAIAFTVLVNLWWLGSFVEGLVFGGTWPISPLDISTRDPFVNFFRGIWSWAWYRDYKGMPYVPFAENYWTNSILIATGFAIPIVSFVPLLVKKVTFNEVYAAFLYIIGFSLAKGANEPFGWLYASVISNVPGFSVFRSPHRYFGGLPMLGQSIQLGLAITYALASPHEKKIRLLFKSFIPAFLMLGLMINAYPLLNGDVTDKWWPARVRIPEYYYEAADWINEQPDDFAVLQLPKTRSFVFNWGYSGEDILRQLARKTVLSFHSLRPSPENWRLVMNQVYELIESGSEYDLAPLLNVFGIKYLAVSHDLNYTIYDAKPPEAISQILSNQPNLRLIRTFGSLEFYLNQQYSDDYKFYAARNILLTDGPTVPINEMANVVNRTNQVSFWKFDGDSPGEGRVSFPRISEKVLRDGNTTFLEIKVEKGNYRSWRIWNWFSSSLNLSLADSIMISWLGSGSNSDIYLLISSNEYYRFSDYYYLSFIDNFIGWRNVTLILSNFQSSGTPTKEKIFGIAIQSAYAGQWGLGGVFVKTESLYPASDILIRNAISKAFQEDVQTDGQELEVLVKSEDNYTTITMMDTSPTRYSLLVSTDRPFYLVFREAFHGGWIAKVRDRPLGVHLKANGYANSWLVDEVGQYALTVEFTPQTRYLVFSLVSILFTLSTVVSSIALELQKCFSEEGIGL